jgi:hypothetical protein
VPTYEEIVKIKESVESQLQGLANVHAVGVGKKRTGGKFTDQIAIVVLVEQKRPRNQLSAQDLVPPDINGIKTDVREVKRPRRHAAPVSNLVATPGANNTVTFSGKQTPGAGLVVQLLVSVTRPDGVTVPCVGYSSTIPTDSLNDVVTKLANNITQGIPGITATATPAASPTQVALTAAAGFSATLTACTVTAVDDKSYRDDHLRGGIQIQVGASLGGGTLGLLGTTTPTTQDPQGKVVAITCQHVVASASDQPTSLGVAVQGNQITFQGNTAPPNSLVQVTLGTQTVDNQFQVSDVFCSTQAGEALNHFVGRVKDAINQASILGVTATQGSPPPNDLVLTLNLPADVLSNCIAYGPADPVQAVNLTARALGSQLVFDGDVSDENYGIYVRVNADGVRRTCGVFLNPSKNQNPTSIASAIATSFNNLPATYRGSVTASPTGAAINFDTAQSVDCSIRSDIRVGQPDNNFSSSRCCSHRFGRVLDAKISSDVAIIELDDGQKWVPEIEGFGLVAGPHFLDPSDLHILVQKRGRTMPQMTTGFIDLLQLSGNTFGDNGSFDRHYVNAILVSSHENTPFSLPGDSGAAVVDIVGGVVGILFGASGNDTESWVTPIDQIITDDFPDLQLNVAPAPEAGKAPGDVRTVPKHAMAGIEPGALAARYQSYPQRRLAEVEQEISATEKGLTYVEAVRRHFPESQKLVNTNRRVATVWHRNGGPQILQALVNMLQRRDEPLPREIEGRPLVDCVRRIREIIARYASPALVADLGQYGSEMERFAGLSYTQMLAVLRAENGH